MIEIETQYTLDAYKEYTWFAMFRGKHYRAHKVAFAFLTAFAIFLLCISVFWLHRDLAIAVSAFSVVCCVVLYIVALVRPGQYYKKSPLLFQTKIKFVLDDDALSMTQAGAIASGTSTMRYDALYRAYETKNAFYLYISPLQAYLLTKKDVVKGTPEELRALLQSKLPPKKYVICK